MRLRRLAKAKPSEPDAWSTAAVFVDIDNDGDLDLAVGNYVSWSKDIDLSVNYRLDGIGRAFGPPTNFEDSHSSLYRNEGDGTLSDISELAGIQIVNPSTGTPMGKALGLAPIDIDRDGNATGPGASMPPSSVTTTSWVSLWETLLVRCPHCMLPNCRACLPTRSSWRVLRPQRGWF